MSDEVLKSTIVKWGEFLGKETVLSRLILTRKVSVSTAEQLLGGRYVSRPRGKLRTILIGEMTRDGFSLTDEAAS